jgi:Chaperone of endosialidase
MLYTLLILSHSLVVAQSILISPSNNILKATSIGINDDGSTPNAKLHVKGVGSTPTITPISSQVYSAISAEAIPTSTGNEVFSVYGYATNSTLSNAGLLGLSGNTAILNHGVLGMSVFDGAGDNFGVKGVGTNMGTGAAFGVLGSAYGNASARALYGVYGEALSFGPAIKYAGYFDGDVTVTGTVTSASDYKLKNNLSKITNGLGVVMKLSPYTYQFEKVLGMNLPEGNHHGFIAQDIQSILPELVSKAIHPAKYDPISKAKTSEQVEFLSVNYIELIPYLVKAIQEQQIQIEALKNEIERLRSK